MPAKATEKLDAAALLKKLTAGFETKPTKRGGKEGFVLVQHDGRTLAMASIKDTGALRLEGARLAKNMTIIDARGVEKGRRAIEAVRDENLAKAREAEAKKAKAAKQPTDAPKSKSVAAKRVEQAKAKSGVQVVAPSSKRARSKHNRVGVRVA
jgi:hypothetical protein